MYNACLSFFHPIPCHPKRLATLLISVKTKYKPTLILTVTFPLNLGLMEPGLPVASRSCRDFIQGLLLVRVPRAGVC